MRQVVRKARVGTAKRGALFAVLVATMSSCSGEQQTRAGADAAPVMQEIHGIEQFQSIVENASDRLLVFDLYADWCAPCKILTPLLEGIAQEKRAVADFYKINVDRNQQIAAAFGVQGIPLVVFVRNREAVHAITGLRPRGAYVRAVEQFSAPTASEPLRDRPDGEIVDGIRHIALTTSTNPGDIYVYRGDEVRLVIDDVNLAYSISIPDFGIVQKAAAGEKLNVSFKASRTGVFPMFCNGPCPEGEGSRYGRIVVLDYDPGDTAVFDEMNAAQSRDRIAAGVDLILDVRTPNEFHAGHIEGARLLPLQQLSQRIGEIAQYRNRDVVLYCRTGNRSTVAAQILVQNGFTNLYHVRPGIAGWRKAGYPVVTGSHTASR